MSWSTVRSGKKEDVMIQTGADLSAQAHPEIAAVMEALIKTQPGSRVSVSASGSTYNTDGKVGGSASINISSDTPDEEKKGEAEEG